MTLTPEQIADGWIAHDGGECPFIGGGAIYVMLRCGIMGWAMPSAIAWHREAGPMAGTSYTKPTDIIAYKPEPTL